MTTMSVVATSNRYKPTQQRAALSAGTDLYRPDGGQAGRSMRLAARTPILDPSWAVG